jgi:hypothetical protein
MDRKCIVALVVLIVAAGAALADVPQLLNYQGKLADKETGAPLDEDVFLGFGFFDAPTGGYRIYYEEHNSVQVKGGVFNVLIGNGSNPVGPFEDVPLETNLYLELTVDLGAGPEVLAPRTRIASTVYALRAKDVDGLDIANILSRLADLEEKLARFTVSETGNNIYITGANLHIRNGAGATDTTNGEGNLIVGYNESLPFPQFTFRGGSHNIVLGIEHSYTGHGGLVAGQRNAITGCYASVYGGRNNKASGDYSCVVGGGGPDYALRNEAYSHYSAILGGSGNMTGDKALGGDRAIGQYATVSGGQLNEAYAENSSILGGSGNHTYGGTSSVSGGKGNTASGEAASVSGGWVSTASGDYSSVSGGWNNTAGVSHSSVSGGEYNRAHGYGSTIGGGYNRVVWDNCDWRAGDLFEDQ